MGGAPPGPVRLGSRIAAMLRLFPLLVCLPLVPAGEDLLPSRHRAAARGGPAQALPAPRHVMIYHKPGRFAGWPANHGIWSWGDEILVGFSVGAYRDLGP